jgi:hypothetical protein
MRRSRLGALGALCAVALVVGATGVAPAATPPSATASQAFAAGSPSAISCSGAVNARVTLTSQAGTTGTATAVMLTLDVSGSILPDLAELKQAAKDALAAIDAADGATDQSIATNSVGLEYYMGNAATVSVPLGSTYNAVLAGIDALPVPSGGSPHDVGITAASNALAAGAGGRAKAIVLMSDGQTDPLLKTNTDNAANAAKASGVRIVSVGIGTFDQANLTGWSTPPGFFQSTPINKTQMASDLGLAVAAPSNFTLTGAHGPNFSLAPQAATPGTSATSSAGTITWTGSLTGSQTVTLDYTATRNGSQVFATTNEVVSAISLAVSGGTGTVTSPSLSIDVLPCGATPIAATTCTGAACSVSGTQGGVQYTASAGNPPAGTTLTLSSLNAPAPPAGACAGFSARTQGAEYDVRPLSTDSTIRMLIPRASLGNRRWFETDVCLGTNLQFITAISSLFNLTPQATFVPGGTVPGRWWGLLPSIPRFEFFPGHGFVLGPYITSRAVDASGNAIINFKVPFVPNSTGLTTDGKPAYDPKLWGG